jgi:hypothetical protein
MFGNGVSSLMRGGVGLSEKAIHLLHCNLAQVYPHSHSIHIRAFVLYGHHACFVTLLQ